MQPYVIRERSIGKALNSLVLVGFGLAWGLFALRIVHAGVLFAAAGPVLMLFAAVRITVFPTPALAVDPNGFRLDDAVVPWPSLWQVVIILPDVETGPARVVEVGLRLYRGAPLPSGMDSVVYDPRDPLAMQRRRTFDGGVVDPGRLTAAVRTFGRAEVLESRGGRERRIA